MNDPKYAYPYPAQGYYQGPPVMAPPQYAAQPPRREPGFLEGCLAALCCCCLVDECCCDPSIIFAVALSDQRESSHGDYVTFNLAAYTRAELKEVKKRLISELQQVRRLRARIESREVESRTNYPASQFSGSYGRGREVASITRPPPLQLNYALESLGSAASKEKEKRTPKANQYYPSNEFLTGKNKMVPPSAKEKVSGNKRALHFASGRDSKRPVVLDSQVDKLVTSIMRRCRQILTKLMKDKHGWVFNTPVDTVALGLHDYHQIIKHPMDLGTVMSRLDKNEYRSPLDFASDVRLTFSNAMTYNSKGQDVYIMAELLLSRFEEMFNPA
ncbi:hypothetical protein F0562_006163 [Nyssa sinensis]|uniref:Bromo domain-containing protein n=1 Tax=Nyssa sinensis TaxID=561372 RepID=A0A5J5AMG5_9ASTE|nr:hypothetical protein F0562_006163 [Nyssa sinensis]